MVGWGQIKKLTKAVLESIAGKPREKSARLWDNYHGLYVEVSPRGTVNFAMKYRRGGKERREPIGRYPGTSLEDARRKVRQVRAQLDRNEDPRIPPPTLTTFKEAAEAWKDLNRSRLAPRTMVQVTRYLAACAEGFGKKGVDRVTSQDVLDVLRKFEARGRVESAKRARIYAHQVFDWALPVDHPFPNPASNERLRKKLTKRVKVKHHAAMPAARIPDFLKRLAAANVHPSIRAALAFTAMTVFRTGEVLELLWTDLAEDGASATIPEERMKGGVSHTVFFSRQAQAIIEEIRPFSGSQVRVFPGRNPKGPLSNMAMLMTLTRMAPGYTVHGFRSSFSTWAHASGAAPHVVERCLAHASADKVAAAYNRHRFDQEAGQLWQRWADAIDWKRT